MRILIAMATLAFAVSGFAQNTTTQIKKVPVEYTDPSSGTAMFTAYCAPCHGKDAKGTGPAAPALKKAPADLTMLSAKNKGQFPSGRVQAFIKGDDGIGTDAHGTRDMPIWGYQFRSVSASSAVVDLRVQNLSDYIKSIQQK